MAAEVRLAVHDLRGRRVAILADGWYAGYVGYGLLVGYGPNKVGRYFYGKTPALAVQLAVFAAIAGATLLVERRRHPYPAAQAQPSGGLARRLPTGDPRLRRAAKALRAGSVWVNCFDAGDMTTPFGGAFASGSISWWSSRRTSPESTLAPPSALSRP